MENYTTIQGFPNYSISNQGNVKNNRTGRIKSYQLRRGYPRLTLEYKNTKKKFAIHRLVALHFIPNPDNLPQVNHKDGNKENNNVSNLEWVSCSDNLKHSYRVLKRVKNARKLSDEQVAEIKVSLYNGVTQSYLAQLYGVCQAAISKINTGKSYPEI